ncbi:DMT family transporter [Candidatus Saccharibacteria bacterium]|nr:DMT family transporter [Candidatus Saccharibacteria bacterium]MBI3338027.1 DMT family transporter [Candidatus Saccharibacteria bacterium]
MMTLFAYLFYFVAASASPLQRRWLATKREQDNQISFAFHTTLIIAVLGLMLPLFSPFRIHGNTAHLVLLALTCAGAGSAYFITNYTAQRHVDATVTNIIVNIYTPVTIIIATLFLGEGLTPLQVIGTTLLLASVIIVSKNHQLGRFKFDKYFLMMLASGVLLGILLSAERALMKTTGFTAGTLLSWWSQCLGLGFITLLTRSHSTYNRKDTLVTGGLKFLQAISWVTLLNIVGNLSIVSAVTTFKIVVIFGAAALWLNERDHIKRKILGCLIALIGLLLMK